MYYDVYGMKVTALDLKDMGLADEIIPEPVGGVHNDFVTTSELVKNCILKHIDELSKLSPEELIESRILRFEQMGRWEEGSTE